MFGKFFLGGQLGRGDFDLFAKVVGSESIAKWQVLMAGTTGLEPATSDVTGRRSNQLSYVPAPLTLQEYHLFRASYNR